MICNFNNESFHDLNVKNVGSFDICFQFRPWIPLGIKKHTIIILSLWTSRRKLKNLKINFDVASRYRRSSKACKLDKLNSVSTRMWTHAMIFHYMHSTISKNALCFLKNHSRTQKCSVVKFRNFGFNKIYFRRRFV